MTENASLKRRVVSGLAWASATRLLGQLLNWAMTLAVIHYLTPSDYGLVAIAMAVIGFLQSLSNVGFADALVQSQSLDDIQRRQTFGFVIFTNVLLLVVLCIAAYPISWLYNEPRLVHLLQFASLTFLLLAVSTVPRATLDRALALKKTSRVEFAANLVGGITVFFLAWRGLGVWSLMIGMMSNLAFRSAGMFFLSPYWQLPIFRMHGNGAVLRFGGLRTAEQALWYLSSQTDIFLAGRILGAHSVGVYSVARTIAALPIDKIAAVVRPIGFATFANIQSDRGAALTYLAKAMRILALFSFPAFFGIAAVAPEIVHLVLGPKWGEAVGPLMVLSIGMALRPTGLAIPSFLMGLGEIRATFLNTLFGAILFTSAYFVGSFWGILGICIGGAIAYPIQFLALVRRVTIVTDCSPSILLAPLVRPLLCAIAMFAVVSAGRLFLSDALSPIWLLFGLMAIGVSTFSLLALVFCRAILTDLLSLLQP